VVNIRRGAPGRGPQRVLVAVHPVGGNVLCYRELLDWVPKDISILGIQSRGDGAARTVADMAAAYVAELLPHLPAAARVHLLGWSMGGVIAHEMAGLLEGTGISVAALSLIDSWVGNPMLDADAALDGTDLLKNFARDLLQTPTLPADLESLALLSEAERGSAVRSFLGAAGAVELAADDFDRLLAEHQANFNALIHHRPRVTAIAPLLFRAKQRSDFPFLVPFPTWVGSQRAGPPMDLDATHFSIARGECLRLITERTTFGAGAFA
jgi:thioesterase domain-containing protein